MKSAPSLTRVVYGAVLRAMRSWSTMGPLPPDLDTCGHESTCSATIPRSLPISRDSLPPRPPALCVGRRGRVRSRSTAPGGVPRGSGARASGRERRYRAGHRSRGSARRGSGQEVLLARVCSGRARQEAMPNHPASNSYSPRRDAGAGRVALLAAFVAWTEEEQGVRGEVLQRDSDDVTRRAQASVSASHLAFALQPAFA
jgi:hypothetical protein